MLEITGQAIVDYPFDPLVEDKMSDYARAIKQSLWVLEDMLRRSTSLLSTDGQPVVIHDPFPFLCRSYVDKVLRRVFNQPLGGESLPVEEGPRRQSHLGLHMGSSSATGKRKEGCAR